MSDLGVDRDERMLLTLLGRDSVLTCIIFGSGMSDIVRGLAEVCTGVVGDIDLQVKKISHMCHQKVNLELEKIL